ncbi:MAG: sugar phosphate isomerase/epimerase [Solirubrobacteraceae bacterium]|nr:sugar phosphate isomerase/epimerase [Solirubrobacteraceae bacterium]
MTRSPSFSVCQLTLSETSFEEDLEICRRTGVPGLGIDAGKLTGDDELLRELMARHAVRASLCVPSPMSLLPLTHVPGPDDPAERLAAIRADLERLARFRPATVFVLTGGRGSLSEDAARELVVSGLRELAQLAGELGVTLSLEPMRESFRADWTLVCGLDETVELLDEAGGDIEILYDAWHMWDGPDALELTERYASRIAGVHVADYRVPTRSQLDRVLPGDGAADLAGVFAALQRGGFDGWYDLEVFSQGYPDSLSERDPVEWIAAGKRGFERIWEQSHSPA